MRYFLLLLGFPLYLFGFEPIPVTPYPVVGYTTLPVEYKPENTKGEILIWYPVDYAVEGKPSESAWDVFRVAKDATPLSPEIKKPLIVLSHGHGGNPHQLSWLIRGLTRNGYLVIAVTHRDLIDGKVHLRWTRPLEIQTLLDTFAASKMADYADLSRIGFAGFSLGGTTGISVIGGRATKLDSLVPGVDYASSDISKSLEATLNTAEKDQMAKDWTDSRIKAAFLMAPAWAWIFEEKDLQQIQIPTYIIASLADKTLVTKKNAGFFARNIPGAFYQNIPGYADHFVFVSALNEAQQKKANPTGEFTYLFMDDAAVDRVWIQDQTSDEAVDFFNWALNPVTANTL